MAGAEGYTLAARNVRSVLPRLDPELEFSPLQQHLEPRILDAGLLGDTLFLKRQVLPELSRGPEGGRHAGALLVGTFAYPGWTASIDGTPAEIQTDSRFGAIQIQVPAGEHEIQLEFGSTPARRIGAVLSALAALGWIAGSIVLRGRRSRTAAV